MTNKKHTWSSLPALLGSPELRRAEHEGRTYYAAADAVALLSGTDHPADLWADLKAREPRLADLVEQVQFGQEVIDALDVSGVLRLVQSVPSPRAERLKAWLAEAAIQTMEEAENPELAILRSRKLYEEKGYGRRWVDKRLRGVSARHELTGEWFKRGADGEAYRELTNELMNGTFGLAVEDYRRFKNLTKPAQNLRDHMTDLELVLTMLSETTAAALHRERSSQGVEQLKRDVQDAGEIALRTRQELEDRLARPLVSRRNHVRTASTGWRTSEPATRTNPDGDPGEPRRVKVV